MKNTYLLTTDGTVLIALTQDENGEVFSATLWEFHLPIGHENDGLTDLNCQKTKGEMKNEHRI